MSDESVLVWRKNVRKRRRIGNGKRLNHTYFETISWRRSDDDTLFTTRSAPRTPPVAMSVSSHKKPYNSDSAKRPCACGNPQCNEIAKYIAKHDNFGSMQSKLVRHTVGPHRRHLYREQPQKSRKKRERESAAAQRLQSALKLARVECINMLRKDNGVKALRGAAIQSAVFNVACHYPVSFIKKNERNARFKMSTSRQEWKVTPFREFRSSPDAAVQVLCVPQLDCDTAEVRWAVPSSSSEQESSEAAPPSADSDSTLIFDDNITYVNMNGEVQPANWSGNCKYNFMNPDKYSEDPRLCKRNFGYPGTFIQLVIRITCVWFPFVETKRSSMKLSAKLTPLEECLSTLYFLKHASPSCDQVHLQKTWGLSKQQFVCFCLPTCVCPTTYLHTSLPHLCIVGVNGSYGSGHRAGK